MGRLILLLTYLLYVTVKFRLWHAEFPIQKTTVTVIETVDVELSIELKMSTQIEMKASLQSFTSGLFQDIKNRLSFRNPKISDGRYDNFVVEKSMWADQTSSYVLLTIES